MILAKGLVLSALIALGTSANAQGDTVPINRPYTWMSMPTGEDVERLYPQPASEREVGGVVLMGCSVLPGGTLSACHIYAENPTGWNFGVATVALAQKFRLKPGTLDHATPVPNWVVIPMIWETGRIVPRTDFALGDTAGLLKLDGHTDTSVVDQGIGCLTNGPPSHCSVHQFYWTARPDRLAAARSVLKVGKTRGLDQVVCTVDADGSLGICGGTSPEAASVVGELKSGFKAPKRTADGALIGAGPITIQLDWAAYSSTAAAMRSDPALSSQFSSATFGQ